MPNTKQIGWLQRIRVGLRSDQSDASLLAAYVDHRDDAAFESIVHRHAGLVYSVCQRTLRDRADIEDAFQATFLVLVRKAGSIRPRHMLPGWLHGVAHKVALKSLVAKTRRQLKEVEAGAMPKREADEHASPELLAALDREIARLPDEYRTPLVLCEIEGKTRREVARILGWPEGTVASRTARGRDMLARRLRKVGATTFSLAGLLIAPPVRAQLTLRTIEAASRFAVGTTSAADTQAAILAQEVIKGMFIRKLKIGVAVLVTATFLGVTVPGQSPRTEAAPAAPPSSTRIAEKVLRVPEGLNSTQLNYLINPDVRKEIKSDADLDKLIADGVEEGKRQTEERMEELNRQLQARLGAAGGRIQIGRGFGGPDTIPFEGEAAKKILAALRPEQVVRLKQLDFQSRGPAAFIDRKVIRALRLTEEQEDKLDAIQTKFNKVRLDEFARPAMLQIGGPGAEPAASNEKLTTEWAKSLEDGRKVLNSEQAALWDDIVGKPAPMSLIQALAGPGRPGGGPVQFQGGAGGRIAVPGVALPIAPPPPPPPPAPPIKN